MFKLMETRSVFFSSDEVLDALSGFRERQGHLSHEAFVEECVLDLVRDGTIIGCYLGIKSDSGLSPSQAEGSQEIHMSAEEMLAAFVFYCRNRRIPLPAASVKELQSVGESVQLTFSMVRPSLERSRRQ